MAFLLTTEPWIPCRMPNGARCEFGLLETLARAHEIEAVHDTSPPVTLALHRLLLAILHRVFGPSDMEGWLALYRRGAFKESRLQAYLAGQEGRLDLLHPERPFLQVRGLTTLYPPNGLGRLLLERSNYGAAVNVFQHRDAATRAHDAIDPAQAARALLVLQAFAPGGLVKKKGEPGAATAGPLNRGAFVLVHGGNLFETLMMNLLVYAPERDAPIAGAPELDLPSWEQPELPRQVGEREVGRRPQGWIDLLTWQSRRLELEVDEGAGGVTGVVYCVGQGLEDDGLIDPMLACRADKERGLVAIDLSDDRALWRDAHALVRRIGADGARPPAAISQLTCAELRSVTAGHREIVLDVIGMRGDQAKIRLARHERLSVPATLLWDPERLAVMGRATRLAEEVGMRLTSAIRDAARIALAPDGGHKPDEEDVRKLAQSVGAASAYWASLAVPFAQFLDDLAQTDGPSLALFWQHVSCAARESLRRATDALGAGAANLHGAAVAERGLAAALRDAIPRDAFAQVQRGGHA
jgi:CRISPR system Cascade subunit CasA